MPSYADYKQGYANLWGQTELDAGRVGEIDGVVDDILANKERYRAAGKQLGVPWFWIAPVHYRESSLDFGGAFHNGDGIIGTGKKTRRHPAGRGPFPTWEDSVVDALEMKGLGTINEWPVERCLYQWEDYNGWGYFGRENSPYVWAGTNLSDETGKYVADHQYDPSAPEKQLGCAAILKRLVERDEDARRAVSGKPPVPEPEPKPVEPELTDVPTADLIAALIGRTHKGVRISNVLVEYSQNN